MESVLVLYKSNVTLDTQIGRYVSVLNKYLWATTTGSHHTTLNPNKLINKRGITARHLYSVRTNFAQ